MSISVAQMGARMNYAIPRILNSTGTLDRLFTDLCAVKGWPRLLRLVPRGIRPAIFERLVTRIPKGLPTSKITAFTGFGFDYGRRLARAQTTPQRDEAFLWAGREFGRLISQKGLRGATAVYGFNTASKEVFEHASSLGIRRILEQTITPRLIEQRLMDDESEAFPDWERIERSDSARRLGEREQNEWEAADLIVCASDYVKDGIVACGGAAEKCTVIPYGIEQPSAPTNDVKRKPGKMRVLTVGAVGLRKGSPYVMKAAQMLRGIAEFRMTGPLQCSERAVSELGKHVQLTGIVPRSQITSHYAWADIYLLPSLCEGSATSTYEAMLHGLPVICTPHTGSVVRDGVDGYIVPERNPEIVAQLIQLLAKSPDLLKEMSESAFKRASLYTLDHYSANLLTAFCGKGILGTLD